MAANDEVLTVKEVCYLLRVHPSTLYKMVRQGSIPSFRVGLDWRFRRDEIERWTIEQSMYTQRVRKVIETGVNGEAAVGERRPYVNLTAKAGKAGVSAPLLNRLRNHRG